MRLVIAFDQNFEFRDTDIVISDLKPYEITDANFIKVEIDGKKDYINDLENFKTEYLNQKTDSLLRDVVISSTNNFYRNWIMPLFAWVETLERTIAENHFSEIIVSGYTKDIGYVPYYEAEGEINKKLLYKSYDAIPAYLCKILKDKNINFSIHNRKYVLNLKLRIFIRRYVLLTVKFLILYFKSLKTFFKTSTKSIDINPDYVFYSRGIAHTEFIEKFIKTFDKTSLIHVADGIVSNNKNQNYVVSNKITNAMLYGQQIRSLDVLLSYFKVLKSTLFLSENVVSIASFSINFKSVQKEMLISYFDALIYKKTIERNIPKSAKILVTCEMYTPFAYVVSNIAKAQNLISVQLQSTSMSLRKEPEYFYCDYFAVSTQKNAEEFRAIFNNQASKIKYFGNLGVDETLVSEPQKNNSISKVIYFSQPITSEDNEEQALVRTLTELSLKLNFQFLIKLHPRDNKKKFEAFNNVNYIPEGLTFNQYINNVDLAVFRTTSLGQQLLINNTPTIVCLLTELSRQFKVDYIDPNYLGTINNVNEIETKLENYDDLLKAFQNHRNDYLNANNLDKGLHYFYKQLSDL